MEVVKIKIYFSEKIKADTRSKISKIQAVHEEPLTRLVTQSFSGAKLAVEA